MNERTTLWMPSPTPRNVADAYQNLVLDRAGTAGGKDGRVTAREAEKDPYVLDAYERAGRRRPLARTLGRVAATAMREEAEAASRGDHRVSAEDASRMPEPFASAFVELRRPRPNPERLVKELERAAEGLFYVSEADAPYRAFHVPLSPTTALTSDALKTILRFAADEPFELELDNGDEFWAETEATMLEAGYPPEDGAKYRALDRLMKQAFVKTTIMDDSYPVAGKIFIATPREEDSSSDAFYIFGRLTTGELVGVRTERVWT